jgi:tRNA1(Val) A37 N6-methylase TrmN6
MPDGASDILSVTTDSFLGGRISLRQPQRGHRAGTDAVLLASAVPDAGSGLLLDIGAGVGAAGLAAVATRPRLRLGLVEIDAALAGLATENLALNGLAERGCVHAADLFDRDSWQQAGLAEASAQIVITNPPFFDPARSRLSPDAGKRAAHVMPVSGPSALEGWIDACLALLVNDGIFIIIHRPDALAAILSTCTRSGASPGGLTLLAIHPTRNQPARRILLRCRKGSRAPLEIAPPLVLHEEGQFTEMAAALHRGEAFLSW